MKCSSCVAEAVGGRAKAEEFAVMPYGGPSVRILLVLGKVETFSLSCPKVTATAMLPLLDREGELEVAKEKERVLEGERGKRDREGGAGQRERESEGASEGARERGS